MKKIITLFLFLYVSTANSMFSQFVIIDSKNQKEYGFFVHISEHEENKKTYYKFKIKKDGSDKAAWLVECKKNISRKELEFRDYVWEGKNPNNNVLSLIKIKGNTDYIITNVLKEKINHSFIYIDFDGTVLDGGVYYTIDLGTYVPNNVNK